MIEISKVKTTIPSFLLDRLLQTGMEPVQADVISELSMTQNTENLWQKF